MNGAQMLMWFAAFIWLIREILRCGKGPEDD